MVHDDTYTKIAIQYCMYSMYSTEVLRANMIALGVQYAAVMHAAMYESTKVLSYLRRTY
jgi:hypothetical protein